MASEGYHEPVEWLDHSTIEKHRAVQSIVEELQAADWYDQRVTACKDEALREILAHNRDEEKEHAAMGLEWWRRHDPVFDQHLRTYLFSQDSIVRTEHEVEEAIAAAVVAPGDLGIGSLRGEAVR